MMIGAQYPTTFLCFSNENKMFSKMLPEKCLKMNKRASHISVKLNDNKILMANTASNAKTNFGKSTFSQTTFCRKKKKKKNFFTNNRRVHIKTNQQI